MAKNIALVLSGGGARGMAHIGAIKELLENGYKITSVAGTSIGSLVGGMYALGKMDEFEEWICSLDRLKVFSLVDFTLGHQGLIKAEKVLKTMREFTGDGNIEELPIPYAAVAADIVNREEVVFTKGSLYDAIRASIAIPSVITPIKTDTGVLVDGGVMNNIPVNHVARTESDLLVVVNVNANIPVHHPQKNKGKEEEELKTYQKKMREFYAQLSKINPLNNEDKLSYLDVVGKSISLMIHHIAQMHLEQYKPDILIEVSRDAAGTYDFYKAQELVELGKFAAQKALSSHQNTD